MELIKKPPEKIKLVEINPHLCCHLCKGYYVDATTISECLHSFCRSCIIKFLHKHSYCPICEVIINKAKPNLKLDKTLQDIVYKLVPELFLNEMKRRQRFYQNHHPELAAKVTPEERGEDTERTIFNPRDTISLSIEYISDDSTPGAILIPQLIVKGVTDSNNKKNTTSGGDACSDINSNDENSAIRRFLQCPGMCRVEVLKKFIRNKYNVDTNKYYIDILYKRVPLPDHYTLIDIAYIYSWKRNEPLKFFFKITDINLVTDTFDYLINPQEEKILKSVTPLPKTENVNSGCGKQVIKKLKELDRSKTKTKIKKKEIVEKEKDKKSTESGTIINKTSDADKEYTNITLDRTNNVEIITKIQKVSNKEGLQIGIKITQQTVKKPSPNGVKSIKKEITKSPERPATPPKPQTPQPPPDIDQEKSNFLKSIELTAKNVISPTKIDSKSPESPFPLKRKASHSPKTEKPAKKPRKYVNIQPKPLRNPTVWQMMSNISQNASNVSKIVEQTTPNGGFGGGNSDLQALLFDSYKINIPSSLSVTVKNEKDTPTPSALQKPVQNYIEILKLPETPATSPSQTKSSDNKDQIKTTLSELKPKIEIKLEDSSPTTETCLKTELADLENKVKRETCTAQETAKLCLAASSTTTSTTTSPKIATKSSLLPSKTPASLPSPTYLSCKLPRDNLVKLNPRTPQTFQKMFEEAIKKPEFTNKFQTIPIFKSEALKSGQKSALNLTTTNGDGVSPVGASGAAAGGGSASGGKRNIMEIASKLYKRTKMEQEKVSENDTSPKTEMKPMLNVPRPNQLQKKTKTLENKGNPPLKDFASYISSKNQSQTVTNLHSPSLGLNYTVSVSQANSKSSPKGSSPSGKDAEVTPKSPVTRHTVLSPKQHESGNRKNPLSPKASPTNGNNQIASKLPVNSSSSSSTVKKSVSPTSGKVSSSNEKNHQALSPDQILEKYNIQNLAQLTANLNFSPHLCMGPAANQLAALHQAMIYRHFEMHNHQNWLNMNPGPLVQYEKYLQSLSKSSS